MWGNFYFKKNITYFSGLLPYPTFFLKIKKTPYFHSFKLRNFIGHLYKLFLQIIKTMTPIFYFKLKLYKYKKKRLYTPSLIYVKPYHRGFIGYKILFDIIKYWCFIPQSTYYLHFTTPIIHLFKHYYVRVITRLISFYLT